MKFFKQIAGNMSKTIKESPMIIFIFLVFLAIFISAIVFSLEDYWTTFRGYQMLPTQKVMPIVSYFVAALPQLLQIAFIYIFLENTNKVWSLLFAFANYVADNFTDVYYKASGLSWGWYFGAWVESTVIYTIGSEVMLTISFGMLLTLFPDAVKQVRILAVRTFPEIARFLDALGIGESDNQETRQKMGGHDETHLNYQHPENDDNKAQNLSKAERRRLEWENRQRKSNQNQQKRGPGRPRKNENFRTVEVEEVYQ